MDLDTSVRSQILDAVACGIVVIDAEQRVLVWNRWMVKYSGIGGELAVGQRLAEVFPELTHSRLEASLGMALGHRLASIISPSIHAPVLPLYRQADDRAVNQRMQQLIHITPVRFGGQAGCTIQIQDMTAAVLRERRLREQADELARSNAALQARLDEIQALQSALAEMKDRDALTGLYNRAYLNEALEREVLAARREGKPLALAMVDIDFTKQIDDTYGQQAGDAVLRAMGSLLGELVPAQALACRLGGDEFLMILPGITVEAAAVLAETWRERFALGSYAFGSFELKATCSIGVAGYPQHGKSSEELLQCVDLATYLAKHDGRNRVLVFDAAG